METWLGNALLFTFGGLCLLAAVSDVRSFTIPNRLSLAIAALYPAYALLHPEIDWLGALIVATAVLAVGFGLFAFNILGGGDAKLIAAIMLWAGTEYGLAFIVLTALFGGIQSIVFWLTHRIRAAGSLRMALVPNLDEDFLKTSIPYGLAIAGGGLFVMLSRLKGS